MMVTFDKMITGQMFVTINPTLQKSPPQPTGEKCLHAFSPTSEGEWSECPPQAKIICICAFHKRTSKGGGEPAAGEKKLHL